MGNFVESLVETARAHIGEPFRHHFRPENLCQYGKVTLDSCMTRGVNREGYDCSGLVIASICEVLGKNPREWPRQYRHLKQLRVLEEIKEPVLGDMLIFYQKPPRTHMGLYIADDAVIHASGLSGVVEEGAVQEEITQTTVISAQQLLSLVE